MTLNLAYAACQTYVSASQAIQLMSCEKCLAVPWLSCTPLKEQLHKQSHKNEAYKSSWYVAGAL